MDGETVKSLGDVTYRVACASSGDRHIAGAVTYAKRKTVDVGSDARCTDLEVKVGKRQYSRSDKQSKNSVSTKYQN